MKRGKIPLRKRVVVWLRRHTNTLRDVGWAVRRFFTLEPRPEDIRLRREVERMLDDGIMFTGWRSIERDLRHAMRSEHALDEAREKRVQLWEERRRR